MDSASCHVPLELLQCAFLFLNKGEIKTTRQVCKAFNVAASPFLIPSTWISTQRRDWDVLEAISQHSIFSKSVREIVYDTSYYEPHDANTIDKYKSLLGAGKKGKRRGNPASKYSETSIVKGHCIYRDRLNWQKWFLSYDSEVNAPIGTLSACGSANVHSSQSNGENDLTHLIRALERMPGVRTLSISFRRYQRLCLRKKAQHVGFPRCNHRECRYRRQRTFSLENKHDEDAKAVVLHPRPFTSSGPLAENMGPIWDRALTVIDLACSATKGVSRLRLLFSPL